MREIIRAKTAGFCFGVSRSVEMAEELLKEGAAYSLGQLIHNDEAVKRLAEKGLRVIASPEQLPEGERVLIRSHGVAESVIEELRSRNAVIFDATCPKVKKIHNIVSEASRSGRFVIIIGSHGHPEVEAVCGWCGEHAVCENLDELVEYVAKFPELVEKDITMVIQTTQTRSNFNETANFLKKMCTNPQIFDTICGATSMRQQEASEIANKCDAMVVIGGKHSANSIHLAELCSAGCGEVQFISNADELDMRRLSGADTVGVTAGASAPSWIIKEVVNKMSEEIKIDETAVEEKELSFDEMLENSIKTIYNGDKVTGYVVGINGTEIVVDIGTKYSGFIPSIEFTEDGSKLEDVIKVGDEIEAIVVKVREVEGTVELSKKRLDAVKSWTDVEDAAEDGTVLEGVVTEENKGGIVVNVRGVRVFVPASQSGLPKEAEMSQLLKQKVRLKITEVNRARKRVVGSIRAVAQKERRERAESVWNEIEVGKRYDGVVKSMTGYGAFVDIGGIDGMVHVSEMSWGRIKNPAEVFSVGDAVSVYVISFDKEKRKISLGYKDPAENPWAKFTAKYQVGDTAEVKIVKLMDFGAFAEVLPGVDGLIHISQIANRRIGKPDEVLTVGDVVEAKITAVDNEKQKISLSIRALSEPAPAAVEELAIEEAVEDEVIFAVSADGEVSGETEEN